MPSKKNRKKIQKDNKRNKKEALSIDKPIYPPGLHNTTHFHNRCKSCKLCSMMFFTHVNHSICNKCYQYQELDLEIPSYDNFYYLELV